MSRKGDRRNQIISTQSSAKRKTRKFVHFRGTRDRKNSLLDKNHAWNEGKWDDHDKSKVLLVMIKAYHVHLLQEQYLDDHDSGSVGDTGRSRPSDEGEGGGHPDPEIRGGGQSPKKFFSALPASVWSKDRGAGPLGPFPVSATGWW